MPEFKISFDTSTVYSKLIFDYSFKFSIVFVLLSVFFYYKKNNLLLLSIILSTLSILLAFGNRARKLPIIYNKLTDQFEIPSMDITFENIKTNIAYVYRRGRNPKYTEYFIGLNLSEKDFNTLQENIGFKDKKYLIKEGGFKFLGNREDKSTHFFFILKTSALEEDLLKTLDQLNQQTRLPVKNLDLSGKNIHTLKLLTFKRSQ